MWLPCARVGLCPCLSLPACRLLRQHLAELGACADQSLEHLGLYKPDMSGEVVRLQPHIPTLLAYQQLADAGVTGAPVVSADGQLIANLSISDIRCGAQGVCAVGATGVGAESVGFVGL